MAALNDKNIGDIVKIKENGTAVNYIIVHKGLPHSTYDESCDGVWLLREAVHSDMVWRANFYTNYPYSDVHAWINGTFLNTIDENIRDVIKTVKIPYIKGDGDDLTNVASGSGGLACKAFLLSGLEVSFPQIYETLAQDGASLSYFSSGSNALRIGKDSSGRATQWWLRSPRGNGDDAMCVQPSGERFSDTARARKGVRPAFVVPATLLVDSEGCLSTNTLPTITSDKSGDLGTLTSEFVCNYSVDDEDAGDSLTVVESVDGVEKRRYSAEKNRGEVLSLIGGEWLKISNGDHTVNIECSDGKDSVDHTITFARDQTSAFVTLNAPLEADDIIRFCSLRVDGALPSDTVLLCEVTNNALDDEPVWENCTAKVKSESVFTFKNIYAEKGFAFNFRISVSRGGSGIGGYITKVSGGFE